ncbi:hypothetical protein Z043_120543 [Scleropages formosus]|uniref:Uncharacterized protein n=1 Tax=Scleropages formosus TaxID=113540 RepID=A0A0P7TUN7_SCLFO|nr:hypothetical protein Z043_120543 [Scleropages formosus]
MENFSSLEETATTRTLLLVILSSGPGSRDVLELSSCGSAQESLGEELRRRSGSAAFLHHGQNYAVVCEDFLTFEDKEEIDKLFSITFKPKIFRGDGEGSFTRIISSGKVNLFDPSDVATEVYTFMNMITTFWDVTPPPGGEDTWRQSEGPETTIQKHGSRVFTGTVKPFREDRRTIPGDLDKIHITNSKEDTINRMAGIIRHLCREDCKLEIFQEEDSDQVLVSGKTVEANAKSMATKFEKEDVKNKMLFVMVLITLFYPTHLSLLFPVQLRVKEAAPYWGKHNPAVLVSLLVAGLLLAALLIGGYVLKNHHGRNAKAMKLADESFQVDVESQGNTLVSVAPLPQEPQPPEKPSINGESPDGGKSQPPPTNGHQGPKTPVADTEL